MLTGREPTSTREPGPGRRVYSDKLSGTSTREQRAGLAALLDYAREGDAIVVIGIDRLGRNAAEVMTRFANLASGGSCCGRSAKALTRQTPRDGWWPVSWPVSLSLNRSWVGSGGQPPVRHGEHVVSQWVDRRR